MSSNHRGHNRGEVPSTVPITRISVSLHPTIRYIREISPEAEATARQMYQANVLV